MLLFLFVAAMVALGLAGSNFNAVLDELRRSLPSKFSEEELRVSVGYHVWSPLASDAARQRYVASHLWFSLFAILMGIVLWVFDSVIGAAVFGGLCVLAYAHITWQAYRYKVRGRNKQDRSPFANVS